MPVASGSCIGLRVLASLARTVPPRISVSRGAIERPGCSIQHPVPSLNSPGLPDLAPAMLVLAVTPPRRPRPRGRPFWR